MQVSLMYTNCLFRSFHCMLPIKKNHLCHPLKGNGLLTCAGVQIVIQSTEHHIQMYLYNLQFLASKPIKSCQQVRYSKGAAYIFKALQLAYQFQYAFISSCSLIVERKDQLLLPSRSQGQYIQTDTFIHNECYSQDTCKFLSCDFFPQT